MKEVYIFGHKNPDTDAVTSAIALSYLKNIQGMNTKPYILDSLNPESEFVLKYFGIKPPKILNEVGLQIKDIEYYNNYFVDGNVSILKAYELISEKKVTAIPIVDDSKKLLGLITLKTIANELITGSFEELKTSYNNIIETLKGKEIVKFDNEIVGNVLVGAYKSSQIIETIKFDETSILIVGDRKKVIDYALSCKTKLIILAGGRSLTEEQLETAKKNKINVISTDLDTFHTVKLIGVSAYIKTLLNNARIESINKKDALDTLLEISSKQGFNNYPVITEKGKCDGLIRITDIRKKNRKQVILVDHNEKDQSVAGLEQAEIIEIVDHHKIGDLTTNQPINFRNMSVGSTNTIVYLMYKEARVDIPEKIAGIMFSGIVSDTLNFTSPTTTEKDIEVANDLCSIAKINRDEYITEMFKAGTDLKGRTTEEILNSDLKVFQIEDEKIAVSQVLTLNAEEILSKKEIYIDTMKKLKSYKGYTTIVVFLTDIIKNGSYILFLEDMKDRIEKAFELTELNEGTFMPDILSRKKQIVPKLMKL